jgi:hypothetical protein
LLVSDAGYAAGVAIGVVGGGALVVAKLVAGDATMDGGGPLGVDGVIEATPGPRSSGVAPAALASMVRGSRYEPAAAPDDTDGVAVLTDALA